LAVLKIVDDLIGGAGSTVSGIITLAASASDNVGVDRVDFYVNSLVVGSASRAPYQVSWDSRSSTNGGIALSARAYDAAGNRQSSASVPVTVSNAATPAPTLTSLSPNNTEAGGASFTMTVNGTNFLNGSTVRWNGIARATTFMSATQVMAAINADDVATAGTAQVTVANPDGSVSNASTFMITNPTAPVPSVISISPNTAASGGPRFTLETKDGVGIARCTAGQNFDRDVALQTEIACAIDLAHSAGADRRDDLVRTDASSGCQRHHYFTVNPHSANGCAGLPRRSSASR